MDKIDQQALYPKGPISGEKHEKMLNLTNSPEIEIKAKWHVILLLEGLARTSIIETHTVLLPKVKHYTVKLFFS